MGKVWRSRTTIGVGQTSKYSYSDVQLVNQIDVIDVACEEYVQEVLGFLEIPKSGNPTPTSDPIISSSSSSFTPFEGSDFILKEIKTFLPTSNVLSNLDDDYYNTEGDILYFEKLLNEDPSLNLPAMKIEDLKQVDATMTKPSIEEPPQLELKELSSHLEYAFLEGTDKLPNEDLKQVDVAMAKPSIKEPLELEIKYLPPHIEYAFLEETNKLPVTISKELKDEEKDALLKVLKSYKQAIAWKISDIKGIDP
nr:reverse transcriptase domain-containing protein [Tanacetum cinerariifolium]